MVLTIEWPFNGTVRSFKGLSQAEVNRHITFLSNLRETTSEIQIKITVEDDMTSKVGL